MLAERVITLFPNRSKVIIFTLTVSLMIFWTPYLVPSVVSDTPVGFYSMDDIMGQFPSMISKEGDDFHVLSNLDIPASKPLYLGPGTRILFDEGLYLNLTGAPLFDGKASDMIFLGPYIKGDNWGGVNLMEGDPLASSVIRNTTIEGAKIGIRSHSSDLKLTDSRIQNCSRNGLDIKGPMGTDRSLYIRGTEIINSTYYGIHLLKVENAMLEEVTIDECGTGIRVYMSKAEMNGIDISDSHSIGINSVNSDIRMDDLTLVSEGGETGNQMLTLNSNISVSNGRIGGAKTGIYALTDSSIELDGIRLEDSFSDGILASNAHLDILNCDIMTSGESGLHLVGSSFNIAGTTFNNNGRGNGDLVFSSIYSSDSNGKFEGCTFTGSGYAHIHSVSSEITVGNSTLGSILNEKMVLDSGSRIEMVDTLPPSDIAFLDAGSKVNYQITLDVSIVEFPDMDPVPGAQVDLRDVDGDWIGSAFTDSEGISRDLTLKIFERDSTGVYSYLPVTVIAQKDGYEVTTSDVNDPIKEIEMVLYPPNSGPELTLIGPVNGTKATGNIQIEGDINDDLGVFGVKVRFDEGFYMTFTEFDQLSDGHFRITVELGNISGGLHTLWVHAFDGTHISAPQRRTIMVLDPRMNDTDEDGISDMDEDRNGNGVLDIGETDPNNPDTDGDGLLDGIEIDTSDGNSTDPRDPDSDDDFLKDGFEDQNANGRVDPTETDPNSSDTDGDGVNDRDDHFPLDPLRSGDEGSSEGSITVIILGTLFILFLVVAIYLFIMMKRGKPRRTDDEDKIVGSRPGPARNRDQTEGKRPMNPRRR